MGVLEKRGGQSAIAVNDSFFYRVTEFTPVTAAEEDNRTAAMT